MSILQQYLIMLHYNEMDNDKKNVKIVSENNDKSTTNKNRLEGDDFKKIQKKAKKLGAKSLNYSKRNLENLESANYWAISLLWN